VKAHQGDDTPIWTSSKACVVFNLTLSSYAGAISGCRFIEAHEFDPPKGLDWINGLLGNLPAVARRSRQFQREARSFFYATRADYRAYCADADGVRRDTVRALWHNPSCWMRNRGFMRQGLEAWTGTGVTRWLGRLYRQLSAGAQA
jgi:hypothetical protein